MVSLIHLSIKVSASILTNLKFSVSFPSFLKTFKRFLVAFEYQVETLIILRILNDNGGEREG